MEFRRIKDVRGHIYWNRFDSNYQRQIWHGESFEYDIGISSQFENVDIAFDEDDSTGSDSEKDVAFNSIEMTNAVFDNFDEEDLLNDPNAFNGLMKVILNLPSYWFWSNYII